MPRSAVAVAAALLGVALAGCSPSGDAGAASSPGTPTTPSDRAPATLTVFAAASLTDVFDELAARFEQRHPSVEVVVNAGGSAALAQQVVEGAPADVFASAAEPPMQVLVEAGLAVDPVVFATNTLQLVAPVGNPAGVTGLEDLERDDLRVALCDESVPCGAASVKLFAQGTVEPVPDTLESDVRAVLTKVVLGEVDVGVVYRTDVLAAGDAVEGIEVPGAASVVNRYPVTALTDAADPDVAEEFVAFVTGDEGRGVLGAAGFGAP